jgi:hypothetical protein
MKDRTVRRAARLVWLYPRRWRQQFPDFVEVLTQEIAEHSPGVRRDVVRAAVVERLREGGIISKQPSGQARSGLALIYAALVLFAGLAMGMWSQLRTGLASQRVAAPPVLRASELLLTVGMLAVLVVLPFAIVLLATGVWRTRKDAGAVQRGPYWPFVRPALTFIGSLAVLTVAGWGADRSGWYSPAAVALPYRGPGHFATLWIRGIIAAITPAWVHPSLLARMPTGELVAALVAPLAALALARAVFRLIVRFPLRAPGRANVVLAVSAVGMMLVSVVASVRWLLNHPIREGATPVLARSDQLAPGHTGWVVVLLLAGLGTAALVGLRRVLTGQPDEPCSSFWAPA